MPRAAGTGYAEHVVSYEARFVASAGGFGRLARRFVHELGGARLPGSARGHRVLEVPTWAMDRAPEAPGTPVVERSKATRTTAIAASTRYPVPSASQLCKGAGYRRQSSNRNHSTTTGSWSRSCQLGSPAAIRMWSAVRCQ